MTHRILPASEYARLETTYLGPLRHAIPADARVVVVENDDGRIVASWLAFKQVHLEGCSLAEDYRRNPAVVRHLFQGMQDALGELGAARVYTAAVDDQVRRMLRKMGASQLDGDHYVMEATCLSV